MARVKDLWFSEVPDPENPGRKIRRKTSRHPDNGGNKSAKRWLAVWIDPDGKEHSRAFAKRAEADRYAKRMQVDAERGEYVDPRAARITVAGWCQTWLDGYTTRRPSTVKSARAHVKQILEEFGDQRLASVRPSQVQRWTARLRAEGLSEGYVYQLYRRLAQIMGDAVNDGLITRSPCSRRVAPGPGGQRPYVATTDQVWALHDALPDRYRVAILLGAFVGLRVAEACGLRVADVDFMRGIVRQAVQYPAEPLKTEVSQTPIPIPESLALELSAHVAAYPTEGGTLLSNNRGEQLGPWALEREMRKAREKVSDLPAGFRFHDLRHYLASLLIASGADVKTVQARLRHASATTTLDTYAHLWPDRDESTRAAIDAVISARAEQRRNTAGPADVVPGQRAHTGQQS